MNQGALCLSFLNSLLQNMQPMLVATQSPLFICIWKGLNWLHLFSHLWAKLNLANQGSPCSFWSCCQVSQAFSSLVLILHPGCPSHPSSSHRSGGSCLLPLPVYQALPHPQHAPRPSDEILTFTVKLSPTHSLFPLTGGWYFSLQEKRKRKHRCTFLLCRVLCRAAWCPSRG